MRVYISSRVGRTFALLQYFIIFLVLGIISVWVIDATDSSTWQRYIVPVFSLLALWRLVWFFKLRQYEVEVSFDSISDVLINWRLIFKEPPMNFKKIELSLEYEFRSRKKTTVFIRRPISFDKDSYQKVGADWIYSFSTPIPQTQEMGSWVVKFNIDGNKTEAFAPLK